MFDPIQTGAMALGGLAALALAANQIDDFIRRRSGKYAEQTISPQPFEVKAAAEYVHKHQFEQHVQANTERHGQLFSQIAHAREQARQELKSDTNAMHEKINKVDREVGAIAKGMELQNQQLARIETSLHSNLRRAA